MVQNPKDKPKIKSTDYIYAIGRRKTATARIRLYRKPGDMLVNGVAAGKYFTGEIAQSLYMKPFEVTSTVGKFSYSAKTEGSGKMSQLGAVVHGLSRALTKLDEEGYKSLLKKAGLLTRDSRMKESRKIGTGGKARRKKQSPKR
jgi:small subunit ribosomal protein S9